WGQQGHLGPGRFAVAGARRRQQRRPAEHEWRITRMLSRVADSVYWMSRYIERAENVARFVDVNIQLMLDAPEGQDQQWAPLVAITGDQSEFAKRYTAATESN